MPRKKVHESNAKQAARFRSEAQALHDRGDLNPTEAEEALDKLVRKAVPKKGAD